MGVDLRIFRGAVRGGMQHWWLARGLRLAGIPLALFAAYTVLTFKAGSVYYHSRSQTGHAVEWVAALLPLSLMLIWTLAALNCRRLFDAFIADHGIHELDGYYRTFFRLMYGQGTWLATVPLVLVFAVQCLYHLGTKPAVLYNSTAGHLIGGLYYTVALFLPALLMMAWLSCLLVFLPRNPWPAWMILAAMVVNYLLVSPAYRLGSDSFYYLLGFTEVGANNPTVQLGWLAGLAFTAMMLLLFRWRRYVAGWCCFGVVTLSLAVQPLFPALIYQKYLYGVVPWSMVATLGINAPSSHPPALIGDLITRLLEPVPFVGWGLAGITTMAAWFCMVYATVYYVALNPRVKCPWDKAM